MKNISFVLLAAGLLVFTGCGPEKKSNLTNTTTPANSTFNNPAPANGADPVQTTTPQSQSGTPTANVALNPAHGMPNHRCEIPVGAPLNSTPQAQTNVTAAPQLPAPTLPMPATGSVAAGTNPPHGQPGHDCSIAVGAPLKK